MDLTDLETFVDVMRLGSFAAVARERNVDPSSISRIIARLEQELDIRLFQRTTRTLSPTEQGTAYYTRIAPLLDELAQANDVVADLAGQLKGELRVTASVSFGLQCIVPYLDRFQNRHPDLLVDLVLTDTVVDLVAERIDLAVRLGILADSSLIARRLMAVHYRVCAGPDYLRRTGTPAVPADLIHHNCLLFPLANYRTRWIFRDAQGVDLEVPVRGQTVISNAVALQHCALANMGIALLPHWLVDEHVRAGRLVHLLSEHAVTATDFSNAAWLVYPSRAYVPRKVRAFIAFLEETTAALAPA